MHCKNFSLIDTGGRSFLPEDLQAGYVRLLDKRVARL